MDVRTQKAHRQRWALMQECYDLDIWDDEKHFRRWLYSQFGTTSTRKLTDQQIKVWFMYLKFFTGRIPKLTFDARLPWRIQDSQEWRIEQFKQMLGWSDEDITVFMERQLGVKTFPAALSKEAASTVITGLEQVYNDMGRKGA